jgi:hypothetical protein
MVLADEEMPPSLVSSSGKIPRTRPWSASFTMNGRCVRCRVYGPGTRGTAGQGARAESRIRAYGPGCGSAAGPAPPTPVSLTSQLRLERTQCAAQPYSELSAQHGWRTDGIAGRTPSRTGRSSLAKPAAARLATS